MFCVYKQAHSEVPALFLQHADECIIPGQELGYETDSKDGFEKRTSETPRPVHPQTAATPPAPVDVSVPSSHQHACPLPFLMPGPLPPRVYRIQPPPIPPRIKKRSVCLCV